MEKRRKKMKIQNVKRFIIALAFVSLAMVSTGHADFITPGQGQQPPPPPGSHGTATPQGYQPPASAYGQPAGPGLLQPTAQNIFYMPAAFQNQQTVPMAMTSKILLKKANDPCDVTEVMAAKHLFRTNDRIRFKLQANSDGYLYIFQKGSDGSTNRLFPHPGFQNNRNEVAAYKEYVLPVKGWFRFDATPGMEEIYFFLSRTKIPEFDVSPVAGQNPAGVPMNQQAWLSVFSYYNRSGSGRNLVFEPDPGQSGNGVHATPTSYVAQMASSQKPVISAVMRLKHQ